MKKLITVNGETKPLMEWFRDNRCEVSLSTLKKRAYGYRKNFSNILKSTKAPLHSVGDIIFHFKILQFIQNGSHLQCLCKCKCGNERTISYRKLLIGVKKSCGCERKNLERLTRIKNNTLRIPKPKDVFWNKYLQYRGSAKKTKRIFNISFEEFKKIILQSCFYCGFFDIENKKINGIDRINNDIGYIKNNCVPCCKKCNISKNNLSIETFENHIYNCYNKMFLSKEYTLKIK